MWYQKARRMCWRSFSPLCLGLAPFSCFSLGAFHLHCHSHHLQDFYIRYSIFCIRIQANNQNHPKNCFYLRPTPWAEKAKVSMVDTLKVASAQLWFVNLNNISKIWSSIGFFWKFIFGLWGLYFWKLYDDLWSPGLWKIVCDSQHGLVHSHPVLHRAQPGELFFLRKMQRRKNSTFKPGLNQVHSFF